MTMEEPYRILIFKSESEEELDPYEAEFNRLSHFECRVIPNLVFQYQNLNVLKDCIGRAEDYSGIVFSSPRCVRPIKDCDGWGTSWLNKVFFAVGPKTAYAASRLLSVQVEGAECGNAAALGDLIVGRKHELTKPLLIPCGEVTTGNLTSKLKESGVDYKDIRIYRTIPRSDLDDHVIPHLSPPPHCIVYFSPSGFDATLPILQRLGFNLSSALIGAIGSTTEQHIVSQGYQVGCVAAKPTPQAMVEAVVSVLPTSTQS